MKVGRPTPYSSRLLGRAEFVRQVTTGQVKAPSLSPYNKKDKMLLGLGLAKGDFSPKGYYQHFGPMVIEMYDGILAGDFARFPAGFWQGAQGGLHLKITGRHLMRDVCGLKMGRIGEVIDPQMLEENIPAFLAGAVTDQDKTWIKFFAERKLLAGIRQRGLNLQGFFQQVWPKAFNLGTPAGRHLDLWWFAARDEWQGKGEPWVRQALTHTLEVHRGLQMNEGRRRIDPRLFSDGGKDFLSPHGFDSWRDLAHRHAFYSAIGTVPRWEESLPLAFRDLYSWAFDLGSPEGEHLHFWQLFKQGSTLWSREEDVIAAVRHEALAHDQIPIAELTSRFTSLWIRGKGMKGLVERYPLVELFQMAFNDEIKSGQIKLEELDYLEDNYKQPDQRGRVTVGGTRYLLPENARQLLVKPLSRERIGLFEPQQSGGERLFVLRYTFSAAKAAEWLLLNENDLTKVA